MFKASDSLYTSYFYFIYQIDLPTPEEQKWIDLKEYYQNNTSGMQSIPRAKNSFA